MSDVDNFFSDQDCICYLLIMLKDLEKRCCLLMMGASNNYFFEIYKAVLLNIFSFERKVIVFYLLIIGIC